MLDAVADSLAAAAADVLETMFFSSVVGDAPVSEIPASGTVAVRLPFSGAHAGTFAVRLTAGAAQIVAANFLAEEAGEPTPQQVEEVVCELANMMCGSVLSRLDRDAHFDLGQPVLADATEPAEASVARAFDIGDGKVAMYLCMDGCYDR